MSTSRLAIFILALFFAEATALGSAIFGSADDAEGDGEDGEDSSAGGSGSGGDEVTGRIWEPKPHTDYDSAPDWFIQTAATWGEAKEDGLNNKAWMWRQCPDTVQRLSDCVDADVQLAVEMEKQGAYCRSGWLFKGMSKTLMGCARHCYETFGCERFSLDEDGECRISVGEDSVLQKFPRADMQCEKADSTSGLDVKLYKISFYHVTHSGAYCKNFYKHIEGINTTAQCAHACKNDATCRSFSVGAGRADGGCVHGCRISNCHENTEGSTGGRCRSQNAQCELTDPDVSRKEPGSCYHYQLNVPSSIPDPATQGR